jgi:hypothetical protein
MEELTNESILEDEVDVRHRAYLMTEKKKVILKPITQCNIGMLDLICDNEARVFAGSWTIAT